MPVRRLVSVTDVDDLVALLFDPARRDPVVVVTTRNKEPEPLVDVAALAAEIDPLEVVLLPTGDLTRHLTATLPDQLGVFGGASRIWWPGFTRADDPHRHPLVFAYTAEEAHRARQRLRRELDRWVDPRFLPRTAAPAPAKPLPAGDVDDEVDAVVVTALKGGGDVDLGGGVTAWLVVRRRDPALVVGETVRVVITGFDGDEPLLRRVAPTSPPPAPQLAPEADLRSGPRPGPRPGPPGSPAPGTDAPGPDLTAQLHALQDEVDDLRAELATWRHRAEAAESEAWEVSRQLKHERQERKKERRSLQDKLTHLEGRLLGGADEDDPEQEFRAQVLQAWTQTTVGADRDEWPLVDYAIGPRFLASLKAFPDLRAKIAEVAAEVVSGRVRTVPAREHHALRTGTGGDDPQRVRWQDGATAYRVAVQVKTSQARRLHFWRLPDGSAELACVVLHDDFSIA